MSEIVPVTLVEQLPKLVDFLAEVAGGLWVPVIVAFLLERVKFFQDLASETKQWIVVGLFIGLPLGATALLQFMPPDVWPMLEPYWRAAGLGFIGWLASQVAHEWDKRKLQ